MTAECKRCGGSGKEPDPVGEAWDELWRRLGLSADASGLRQAADVYRGQVQARITFLEAALRDLLAHVPVPDARRGNAIMGTFTASWESLDRWRAVLDGQPDSVTVNQARAEHGLPPLDGELGARPVAVRFRGE